MKLFIVFPSFGISNMCKGQVFIQREKTVFAAESTFTFLLQSERPKQRQARQGSSRKCHVLNEWKILRRWFLSKPPVKTALGNGLQLEMEMVGERGRENMSPLQNGELCRTHSFPTA